MKLKAVAFLLLLLALAFSDAVVVNSKDWRDVYLAIHYADLLGYKPLFVRSEAHAIKVIPFLIAPDEHVILIESKEPFLKDYANYLKTHRGVEDVEVVSSEHPYLLQEELFHRLLKAGVNITGFVLVDDTYGYDAVSVAQYAYFHRMWVLFVSKENRFRVRDFLYDKKSYRIFFYGHMRKEIAEALKGFDMDVLDNKSRFRNNLELAERLIKENPTKQILLTSGEYIEQEIMTGGYGKEIVLFISKDNYPSAIINFIKRHGIKYIVIVGNELINTAREIREALNKKVTVIAKYGMGFVGASEIQGKIFALDLFYLPKYQFNLTVVSAVYNPSLKELYLRIKNNGNVGTYFFTSAPIFVDNRSVASITDKGVEFLEPGDEKTLAYKVDLTDYLNNEMYLHLYTKYGESPYPEDLIYFLLPPGQLRPPYIIKILVMKYEDNSNVTIVDGWYDEFSKAYILQVRNIGEVDAYVKGEIKDVIVDGIPTTITQNTTTLIHPGETVGLPVPVELSPEDKRENPTIHAIVYYGEREDMLIKRVEKDIEFKSELCLLPIAVVLIVLLVLFYLLYRRWKGKKGREKHLKGKRHKGSRK